MNDLGPSCTVLIGSLPARIQKSGANTVEHRYHNIDSMSSSKASNDDATILTMLVTISGLTLLRKIVNFVYKTLRNLGVHRMFSIKD